MASDQPKCMSDVGLSRLGYPSLVINEIGGSGPLVSSYGLSDQHVCRYLGTLSDAEFGRIAVVERITSAMLTRPAPGGHSLPAEGVAAWSGSAWPARLRVVGDPDVGFVVEAEVPLTVHVQQGKPFGNT